MSGEYHPTCERDALTAFLDGQRSALMRKVQGLSEADVRRGPTASSLSLLALLKHSAIWEERWFQGVVAGQPLADGWPEQESDVLIRTSSWDKRTRSASGWRANRKRLRRLGASPQPGSWTAPVPVLTSSTATCAGSSCT